MVVVVVVAKFVWVREEAVLVVEVVGMMVVAAEGSATNEVVVLKMGMEKEKETRTVSMNEMEVVS